MRVPNQIANSWSIPFNAEPGWQVLMNEIGSLDMIRFFHLIDKSHSTCLEVCGKRAVEADRAYHLCSIDPSITFFGRKKNICEHFQWANILFWLYALINTFQLGYLYFHLVDIEYSGTQPEAIPDMSMKFAEDAFIYLYLVIHENKLFIVSTFSALWVCYRAAHQWMISA